MATTEYTGQLTAEYSRRAAEMLHILAQDVYVIRHFVRGVSESTSTSSEQVKGPVPQRENLSTVLSRLADLLKEEEDEKPLPIPFTLAYGLICDCNEAMQDGLPRAMPATSADRGVNVYWKRNGRQVNLCVPGSEGGRYGKSYLFIDFGELPVIVPEATSADLAVALRKI